MAKSRNQTSAKASADLERGRKAYERKAWRDAMVALSKAADAAPLSDEDLQRLVWAAALAGDLDVMLPNLERLHNMRLEAGDSLAAARAAFWLGFRLLSLGEVGRAAAWHSRAERLVDGRDCVESGYLHLPHAHRRLAAGDCDASCAASGAAARIAERFGDADLLALARSVHGRALIRLGRHEEGLALLDEAMLSATSGSLSHVVTGLTYCSVIDCCQKVFAVERAREWTAALADWCEGQPQLATFTGQCRVHRSEIMELQGEWGKAIEEAQHASEKFIQTESLATAAAAFYQAGEIHRLRGEHDLAEQAYRSASQYGREPQPGLALLRLAQGKGDAAAAAIRHVVAAPKDRLERARHLPAAVEIFVATGDVEGARRACTDLEEIAADTRNTILGAMAAHARGALRLAEGNAQGAVEPLRTSLATWHEIGAPYLVARVRVNVALAYHRLEDFEGAELELDAARAVFRELGAAPDLSRLDSLFGEAPAAPRRPFGLTPRELEVLRLVASGKTNRTISLSLFLSEKTIDRHVSNIFDKLDVPSRAAATAFAFKNKLV